MHFLARLMLISAIVLFGCTYVLFCKDVGQWGWALLVVLILVSIRNRRKALSAYGTAAWATEPELRSANMIGARRGLILGRLARMPQQNIIARVKLLFNPTISSKVACQQFLKRARQRGPDDLVRLPDAVHTAVFAPTGAGKGASCIVPFLLSCKESCLVVDYKGELAALTAKARRSMGHEIVLLNPFAEKNTLPFKTASLNPIDLIDKNSRTAIDDCNALAQALVVRTGEEREPHWLDSAEAWISAVIASVVYFGQKDNGTRSLQYVREILSNPQKLEMAVKLMCESDAWGGMLARMGGQLSYFVDKEKSSTLTTTGRFLRFLDTLPVAECTRTTSFDPSRLRDGKMTCYLVVPPLYMHSHGSALMRMWIVCLMRQVVQGGQRTGRYVHAVLDEASSLGQLQMIDDMLAMGRGYSMRLQFYYQSIGQLKKSFPEGQDQTLLSNTTQVFFGVNDHQTADYVSSRLGEETIVVESGGTNRGQSSQTSHSGMSSGTSSGSNSNWQQIGRKLLKPEEVSALPQRTAVTFTPGVPPICTTLLRYYEESKSLWRRGWFHEYRIAFGTLVKSAVILAIAVIVVVVASHEPEKGETNNVQLGGETVRYGQGKPQQRPVGNSGGAQGNGRARRP